MPLINRTKPNVLRVQRPGLGTKDDVVFYPGTNSITDEEFEACKNNAGFNRCMKSGVMSLITVEEKPSKKDDKPEKKADSGIEQVKNMKVKEAGSIIAGILNIRDLEALKETDPRKGIQDLVDAQLEKLKIDDEDKDEE